VIFNAPLYANEGKRAKCSPFLKHGCPLTKKEEQEKKTSNQEEKTTRNGQVVIRIKDNPTAYFFKS
jgi:hypothetical protein